MSRHRPAATASPLALPFALVLLTLVLLPGCGLLHSPTRIVSAAFAPGGTPAPDPINLQVQVQRFADDYSVQTATAIDESVRRAGTEEARRQGLQWKLSAASAAISIASGPQPKANLLDLVSLATLNRAVVEQQLTNSVFGSDLQPWVDASRALESNAWSLAASRLVPQQVAELREGIRQWQLHNPPSPTLFAARPQGFATLVKSSQQKSSEITSVFSLVGLDPTAASAAFAEFLNAPRRALNARQQNFIRQIIDYLTNRGVALPWGEASGTRGMIEICRRAGKPVTVISSLISDFAMASMHARSTKPSIDKTYQISPTC